MKAYETYPKQITCIDTGLYRPGLAACYLIEGQDSYAFIDTGTNHTVPRLLELLANRNIPLQKIEYVIPTHIHLDHAGGAGKLIQSLPNAKLVIHPRGAKHMINPEILQASAMAVYGEEEFNKTYGALVPVPEEKVIVANDGFKLDLSGRELLFLDTPGHAYHHFCIFDRQSQGFFTGDTFGLSYPQLNSAEAAYILPTTTPVQFDPDAWYASLDKLLSYQPKCMYLTHYGIVNDVQHLSEQLRKRIAFYVETALKYSDSEDKAEKINKVLLETALSELGSMNCSLSPGECKKILQFDMDLNTQGLLYWLGRKR